jgi:hypothetical protein
MHINYIPIIMRAANRITMAAIVVYFKVLERGPLSLVTTTEELLEGKVAALA